MDTNRFDSISKLFADRKTRRAALQGGGIGLAAAALGSRAFAQEGTPQVATPAVDPNDPHPSAGTAAPYPETLFVQPFDAGTWAPKDGEDGTYVLSLSGAAAHTVYFSDRPDRIVGLYRTEDFLAGLGFTPTNPPNAAVVAQTAGGEQDVLVIELLNPVWDGAGSLTYDARVLADYGDPGLSNLARQQTDFSLPETFAGGSLFIDDCSNGVGFCYQILNGEQVDIGHLSVPYCGYFGQLPTCILCGDGTDPHYGKICAQTFPDHCTFSDTGWDCFVRTNPASAG